MKQPSFFRYKKGADVRTSHGEDLLPQGQSRYFRQSSFAIYDTRYQMDGQIRRHTNVKAGFKWLISEFVSK